MSDFIEGVSKGPEKPHAPFNCPHCGKPCDVLNSVVNNGLVIFYHDEKGCKKVLGIQIIAIPRMPAPLIAVPGRSS